MQTDSELVMQAREGDRQAFGQLAERHQGAALRLARRMVRGQETASELVQEALLEAYLSLGQLREDTKFAGWLLGVVRYTCLHHIRAQQGASFSLSEDLDKHAGPTPDPEQEAVTREERRLLEAAIGRRFYRLQWEPWNFTPIPQRSIWPSAKRMSVSARSLSRLQALRGRSVFVIPMRSLSIRYCRVWRRGGLGEGVGIAY